jgi:predicted PP-loop superfamily ATPase
MMGMLGSLLDRNVVLLYKQLIRSKMDYACPAWRSASCSHVRRLQML